MSLIDIINRVPIFGKSPLWGFDKGSLWARCIRLSRHSFEVKSHFSIKCSDPAKDEVKQFVRPFSSYEAALSLPDEKVEVQTITLPKMPNREVPAAVNWELKKIYPSLDMYFHEYLAYPLNTGFEVQCFVTPKDLIRETFMDAKNWGLIPSSLESDALALFHCLREINQQKLDRVAIIDLGFSSFRLIFIHQNRFSFLRTIYIGLGVICEKASDLQVDPEDLPYVLNITSEDGDGPVAFLSILRQCHETLYTLCDEMERSEGFLKREKELEGITHVYLSGGGACISSIVNYLKKHLPEKTVETLNPFLKMKHLPPQLEQSSGPFWATAVGLALRNTK